MGASSSHTDELPPILWKREACFRTSPGSFVEDGYFKQGVAVMKPQIVNGDGKALTIHVSEPSLSAMNFSVGFLSKSSDSLPSSEQLETYYGDHSPFFLQEYRESSGVTSIWELNVQTGKVTEWNDSFETAARSKPLRWQTFMDGRPAEKYVQTDMATLLKKGNGSFRLHLAAFPLSHSGHAAATNVQRIATFVVLALLPQNQLYFVKLDDTLFDLEDPSLTVIPYVACRGNCMVQLLCDSVPLLWEPTEEELSKHTAVLPYPLSLRDLLKERAYF